MNQFIGLFCIRISKTVMRITIRTFIDGRYILLGYKYFKYYMVKYKIYVQITYVITLESLV